MLLKNQIQSQMLEAMKAKDTVKLSVLRMLKASIMKFEVEGGERKDATDEDVMKLIQKEIKSRRDSAEQFRKGDRPEQAAAEEKEIEVLMEYMPPQLSEEEVTQIVKDVIAETGAKSKQDLGRVMGALMPKVQGQADGAVVSKIVNSLLG